MDASDIAERADALLDLWSDLSMRHVALGGACACGTGGVSLRLDDFELDIADYFEDLALRSPLPEVVAFFEARAARGAAPARFGARREPLRDLLTAMRDGEVPAAVAEWFVPKAEKTLRSYAELHGGG